MWTDDAGPIPVTPASEDAGLGTLAGVKVTLPGGWLTELDILTLHGGQHGYLGLYSNANDQPSQLVAATSEIIVQGDSPANSIIPANSIPQTTQGPVSPTHIDPGDYWIIGAWDSEIFIISYEYQPPQPPDWYFWTTAFGPLPDTVPGQPSA